jgi:hypothetical protein
MNKRNKLKAALSSGIIMALTFFLIDMLTHDNLTTKDIIISVISAFISGAVGGVLFAWLSGLFLNSKLVTESTKIEIAPDETILFETGANHIKGAEAAGGKLYLTNKRLVFKSHKFNIQNHELSISLLDIDKVDRYKTLGLVNNGLSVITTGNKIEKFVVQQINEWIDQLGQKNGLQRVHLQ